MKSYYILLATAVFFLCLSQCKESGLSSTTPKEEAHNLIQTFCISCHPLSSKSLAPTGPSLSEIRSFYARHYPEMNNFVEAFVRFMQNPNMENAIMKASVHQYGLMPKMMLNSDQVSLIAQLIHSLEPGSDEWISQERSVLNRASPTHAGEIQYEELGKEYAMAVKTTLGKNLIQAINLGGSEYAVGFCHTRAIPLTDSVSQTHKAKIQRVTDRPRNPENTANDTERSIIAKWKRKMEAGEEILPELIKWNQKILAYYPIETNAMCLQCHGIPGKDISETTMNTITFLYPNDLATGYGENQLRGLFKVEMEKEKSISQ